MAWKKSLSVEAANELFSVIGVCFVKDEVEGGYVAKFKDGSSVRRPTLMKCAQEVVKQSQFVDPNLNSQGIN